MKQLLLYGIFACGSISGMEEFNTIKGLLDDQTKLIAYLESQDQDSNTPLMRLFHKATDDQINELLPLLKQTKFNLEMAGPAQETAFFSACDRPGTVAACLMLTLGCQIDTTTPAGRPIFLSFINDNLSLLKLLIQEGANPQIPPEIVAYVLQKPDFDEFKKVITKDRLF